jgi:hypothetical protein
MGNIGQHYYQWRYPNGAPATPPGGTGQTQTNPNSLVAFVSPPTWKYDPTPVTDGPPRTTYLGPGPNQKLVILIENQSNPPMTLDDVLATYVDAARNQLAGGSVANELLPSDTTIGGEPAKRYLISGTRQDNSPVSTIVVVAIHKEKVYSFIILADASPMPNYDDIQGILATMTFQT